MSDLRIAVARLRAIAGRPPTPEARAEVDAALGSKWDGVRAVALDTLAAWGDPNSRAGLRGELERLFARPGPIRLADTGGMALRAVAVRALRRVVAADDVGWVLDLYFAVEGWVAKHELLRLVTLLPADLARPRLLAALRDPRWDNRHAAVKAVGNMP